jgi:hypothetical protein
VAAGKAAQADLTALSSVVDTKASAIQRRMAVLVMEVASTQQPCVHALDSI